MALTENAEERQFGVETAFRLLAARSHPYTKGTDVHTYLDEATIALAEDPSFPRDAEAATFRETFDMILAALGAASFRRWNGTRFQGKFLLSVYEVIAFGVSQNLKASASCRRRSGMH